MFILNKSHIQGDGVYMKDYALNYIDLDLGEKIAYRQAGSAMKTIVLVHGNMSSSVHFQTLMEGLEADYRVYALDLPGFGDSSYRHSSDSLWEMSRYLTEFILKLDLQEVYLLGWSTGGGIVMETAADLGDRIKKIFLLSSVGVQGYPIFRKDDKLQPILTDLLYKREDIEKDPVQVAPVEAAFKSKNEAFFRLIWEASIYNKKVPEKEDYDKYMEAVLKQRNLIDVDVALANFNITNEFNGVNQGSGRINDISAETIIIHGSDDMVVPLVFAQKSKEFFGDKAELLVLDGLGHSIPTDDLEKLCGILKERI